MTDGTTHLKDTLDRIAATITPTVAGLGLSMTDLEQGLRILAIVVGIVCTIYVARRQRRE